MSQPSSRGFRVIGKTKWIKINQTDAFTCIGALQQGVAYELEIGLEPDRDIVGLEVNGKKKVCLRRVTDNRIKTRMTVARTDSGVLHVPYSQNTVNLMEVNEDGQVRMWEVALVSQASRFFVTVQLKYRFSCYRDEEGRLTCPAFEAKWPDMVGRLAEFTMDKISSFPSVAEFAPEPEPDRSDLVGGHGRVLWYNLSRGIGAVVLADSRVARVHWSKVEVDGEEDFVYLSADEVVTINKVVNLSDDGSFKHDAIGVRLVQP